MAQDLEKYTSTSGEQNGSPRSKKILDLKTRKHSTIRLKPTRTISGQINNNSEKIQSKTLTTDSSTFVSL
jgi:hypothetical protein